MAQDAVEHVAYYLRQLWRRAGLVLAVAWPLALAGFAVTLLWPDSYESRARLYVDTETVLQPLLQGLAPEVQPERRIEAMRRALTARPTLERVAQRTGLLAPEAPPLAREAVVRRLAREIRVVADRDTPGLFTVSWRARDPRQAQRLVQALVDVFVETHVRATREDVARARAFIERQIAEQERLLAQAERRLAEFRRRNADYLGGERGYFARLEQVRGRVQRLREELDAARARRAALARRLARTPPTLAATGPGAAAAGGAVAELARLEARLAELRQRFTERHPEVVATRRAVEELRARLAAEGGGEGVPNPVYQQLAAQLAAQDAEIAALEARLGEARRELEELETRARVIPTIEAELQRLTRDWEVVRKNYEALLARREAVRIAGALRTGDRPPEFRLVEPPTLPVLPAGPPRTAMLAATLVGAFGGGIALALLRILVERPFETARALEEALRLPVLATLVEVRRLGARVRAALRAVALTLGVMLLLALAGGIVALEATGGGVALRAVVRAWWARMGAA